MWQRAANYTARGTSPKNLACELTISPVCRISLLSLFLSIQTLLQFIHQYQGSRLKFLSDNYERCWRLGMKDLGSAANAEVS